MHSQPNITRRTAIALPLSVATTALLASLSLSLHRRTAFAVPTGTITYQTPMSKDICPPDQTEADTRIHKTFINGEYAMTQCVNPSTEYATMTRGGSRGSTITVTDAADLSVFGTKLPSGMSFDDFRAVCWFAYEGPGHEDSMYHDFNGKALTVGNKRWITHYVLTYALQGESNLSWRNAKGTIQSGCSTAVYNWAVTYYFTGANSFIKQAVARKNEVPSGWSPFVMFYNDGSKQPNEQMVIVVPPGIPSGFMAAQKQPTF